MYLPRLEKASILLGYRLELKTTAVIEVARGLARAGDTSGIEIAIREDCEQKPIIRCFRPSSLARLAFLTESGSGVPGRSKPTAARKNG